MIKIKIKDINFAHNKNGSTTPFHKSDNIEWLRTIDDTEVIVLTDKCLPLMDTVDPSLKKVAWLLEPQVIDRSSYEFISKNYESFIAVVSHDKEFCKTVPNAIYCPYGTSWILPQDWKQHSKAKSCSLIASNKNMTIGHRLRHKVAARFKNQIDLFGAYKPIQYKLEALGPYMFSIAIENCKCDGYFTEKLIDCFATHTVPIYWGDPSIEKIFDTTGMIIFNTLDDLDKILSTLTIDLYNEYLNARITNLEIAKRFRTAEDQLYIHTEDLLYETVKCA